MAGPMEMAYSLPPRLPPSGQIAARSDEDKETLQRGMIDWYQKGAPISIVEMATPVFRFYQDVRRL